ncbi:sulfotransferase [Sphingomonas sp. LY29]|uniref:tetratricopeptide repeat-containing sulfotransferase family protein n=1 Tax=Sphingomonas sp. LY29 TaxID=3095341 RepID=UPI002D79C38A|nr:sulfotransferase [Sphingomonas sp. LY29]WRP24699.1 sulfotransferase [Sphingomonas sp. LY29]
MSAALDRAMEAHRAGDVAKARAILRDAIAAQTDDATMLHMLGMIEAKAGQVDEATRCFERATRAAPDYEPAWISLARILMQRGEANVLAAIDRRAVDGPMGDEWLHLGAAARHAIGDLAGAADRLDQLADRHPGDARTGVAAARALAEAERLEAAEQRYCEVLTTHPADRDALLGIAGLAMALNRESMLDQVMADARSAGASDDLIALGDALAMREKKDFAAALEAAERARSALPEGTYHQLIGELAERVGDYRRAADAFAAMNDADRRNEPDAEAGAHRYLTDLADRRRKLSSDRPEVAPDDSRASPLFLLGFPRSGTTLLDTFLMGSSELEVHEERGFLDAAEQAGGNIEDRRAAYWRALGAEARYPGRLQVDKQPLGGSRAPLIQAMFPDAKYLFALRHPCDVVWSCFATRFKLNWAMATFLTLNDAAACYDAVMTLWTEARTVLGLNVLDVRYEDLIDHPEPVLRSIAEFAGTAFDPAMLDHRTIAAKRGMIATASHAQVVEPLYSRSNGRWRHYREEMRSVLPTLEPWVRHFGYTL